MAGLCLLHAPEPPAHFSDLSAALGAMANAIAHRLGAAPRQVIRPGLGMAATSILEATAPVPLVAAGDLYLENRGSLLDLLAVDARDTEGLSDLDLALRAYLRLGRDFGAALEGRFLIAIWDSHRQLLSVVRDPLGQAPCYYTHDRNCFALASEIKSLSALRLAPRKLDRTRAVMYLCGDAGDRTRTFYRGVLRLPPAHRIETRHHRAEPPERYTRLCPQALAPAASDRYYAEEFRALLFQAVAAALPAVDRPAGILLSGGLDSALVHAATASAIARRSATGSSRDRNLALHAPLWALTATFPHFPQVDESARVQKLAAEAAAGTRLELVPVDHLSPLDLLDEIFSRLDEPFHAPNFYIAWRLAARARELGLAVMLDGIDGDTIVSHGLERLEELLCAGDWAQCWRESRALARRVGQSTWRIAWRFAAWPSLARLGAGLRLSPPAPTLLRRSAVEQCGYLDHVRAERQAMECDPATLRYRHFRELETGLFTWYLESMNHCAAAFGIDQRHPFCNWRLVRFCLALPPEQRLCDGWDRLVQRRAAATYLPADTAYRLRKSDWSAVFKSALTRELPGVLDRLQRDFEGCAEFVEPAAWNRLARRLRAGQRRDNDLMSVWLVATFDSWRRRVSV